MASQSLIDTIPDELLLRVFNFFELSELVVLMPVARRWNSLIIEHRTYWDDISLGCSDQSPAHHAFFCLRLARSAFRPTKVTVWCESTVMADILRHIAMNLPHIRTLIIITALALSQKTIAALGQPAPILEQLSIFFHEEASPRLPLTVPDDILNCDAPNLRHLYLHNVFLPESIPRAFRGVVKMGLGGKILHTPNVWFSIPNVLALLPALSHLMLYQDVSLDSSFWSASAWANISHLAFQGDSISRLWAQLALPIRDVAFIEVLSGDITTLPILANHLDGDLSLVFRYMESHATRIRVTLKGSKSPTKERQFSAELPPQTAQLTVLHDFWARVTSIVLPLVYWDAYVPFFGALPALEDVVIALVAPWGRTQLKARLTCPKLKRLTVRARKDEQSAVDVEALALLAATVLRDAPLPVELRLVHTAPRGSGPVAMRAFRSVTVAEDEWPALGSDAGLGAAVRPT